MDIDTIFGSNERTPVGTELGEDVEGFDEPVIGADLIIRTAASQGSRPSVFRVRDEESPRLVSTVDESCGGFYQREVLIGLIMNTNSLSKIPVSAVLWQ